MFAVCFSFFEDWLLVNGRGGGDEGQCGAEEGLDEHVAGYYGLEKSLYHSMAIQ